MTVADSDLLASSAPRYRKAIVAGVIGNVLEWYDFGPSGRSCSGSTATGTAAAKH